MNEHRDAPSAQAACVAIVGPANAGKTTLLHQLDQRLQPLLDSVLVIKGNPDSTGRYQFHSPDLRNEPAFKASIKGKWGGATVDRICEWITYGRRNLELALLDFGGKHDDANARMLRCCSHYIVVSRLADTEGGESWDEVCRANGLTRIAWMRSVGPSDPPPAIAAGGIDLQGTFRWNVGPDDTANDSVLQPLVERLVALRRDPNWVPYVNLRQAADWTEEEIPTVAGRDAKIRELATRVGAVIVGGRAPIWAYLAALRCALDANPAARIFFLDPKQPERLVEIPARHAAADFPDGVLAVEWGAGGDGWAELSLRILTTDKFLPPQAAQQLAGAPAVPPATSDIASVRLSGLAPIWLYGVYARWLLAAGTHRLASWDGRKKAFVEV